MRFLSIKCYLILLVLVYSSVFSQPKKSKNNQHLETYTIGLSDNPPISFLNKKNKAEGLIVDIFNELAQKEKFEIKWVFDEWGSLLSKIKNDELDILTSVGFSKERATYMKFSKEGFINSWSSIYLPKYSHIESFLDLHNKTIAVLAGGINGANLISRCTKFEIKCNIIQVKTYTKLFETIANNEVDAVVANNVAGIWYAKKYKIINSSIIFNPSLALVSVPINSNQKLLNLYDKNIALWKNNPNSNYHKIKTKWLTHQIDENMSTRTLYTILGLAFLSLLALLTAIVFKRQIHKRVNELSLRNQQFSQIINLVPHMIYVADSNGNIMLANKKASTYFGMTKEEIERCKIDNIGSHSNEGIAFLNENNLSKNLTNTESQEVQTTDYLGNDYTLLLSKMPFKGKHEEQQENITVAVDITNIKNYQKRIMHMAHYDSLSNLPNKDLFKLNLKTSIKEHIKNKTHGAFLYIDLDSFKNINDSQGHRIGDLLIQAVVQRFKGMTKHENIYHFGGDEFIILLPGLSDDAAFAQELANDFGEFVLNEVNNPFSIEGRVFQITASMGAIIYPRDGVTQDVLLQRSDTALSRAKQNGRDCLQFFDEDLEMAVIENHTLETELRSALDNSQFTLLYQPIIGSNKKIVGSEALLRWNHPTRGVISPDKFIDTAEKIHLMTKIGYWVIEQACIKINENKNNVFISVNISVIQLKDKMFYDNVRSLIENYKIPPNSLEFEITESVLMDDVELSIHIFNKLKLLGVKISIDDFGTGYSSFSYLVKLPIDKIKIDQSFVKNLPQDKNSATIARTIIKMAKELGICVLAEGIETKEQLDFLISEDCDFFQGYYFYKPLNFSKLLELYN